MTRRVLAASVALAGLVAVVAYVRAQEDGTRSVLKSIDDGSTNLASPPPSSNRSTSQLTVEDRDTTSAPRLRQAARPSLADRLKQVRESIAREAGRPAEPSAAPTISVPSDDTPANTASRPGGSFRPPTSVVGEAPREFNPGIRTADSTSSRSSARRANRAPVLEPPSENQHEVPGPAFSAEPAPIQPAPTAPQTEPIEQSFPVEESIPAPPDGSWNEDALSDEASSQYAPAPIGQLPLAEQQVAPDAVPAPPANATLMTTTGALLQVNTIGPEAVVMGKSAEYTISVTNHSQTAADNVYVRIGLPAWVDADGTMATSGSAQPQPAEGRQQKFLWTVDRVEPQGTETLTFVVTPRENRAFDLMVDWTVRPITSVAQIEVQQPRLDMAVFGPKNVLFGETAVYTIQLTNPGNGAAEDVAVEFTYGARRLDKKLIGTLAPGEQNEINVELTAQEAGDLRVSAVATATGGLRAEAQEDVLVRRAALDVRVVGSTLKFAGGVANYRLHVKNTGNATANRVVASILLPAGAKLLTGRTDEAGRVLQEVGSLIPGAERTITLQAQLTVPGENRLQALVSSEGGLESSKAFVTRVDALADLKLTVADPRGPTAVGDDAIYEVTIANRGTKAAEKISIVGQFSEGVEPIEADGGAAELVPGQVLFHPIPRIEPGDEITLKIVARGDRPGNHRFRAELNCKNPDTRLIAEESTFFFGGDDTPIAAVRSSDDEAADQ